MSVSNGKAPWRVVQERDGFRPSDPITDKRRRLWAEKAALNHPQHPANRVNDRVVPEKPLEQMMENVVSLLTFRRDFDQRHVEFGIRFEAAA